MDVLDIDQIEKRAKDADEPECCDQAQASGDEAECCGHPDNMVRLRDWEVFALVDAVRAAQALRAQLDARDAEIARLTQERDDAQAERTRAGLLKTIAEHKAKSAEAERDTLAARIEKVLLELTALDTYDGAANMWSAAHNAIDILRGTDAPDGGPR